MSNTHYNLYRYFYALGILHVLFVIYRTCRACCIQQAGDNNKYRTCRTDGTTRGHRTYWTCRTLWLMVYNLDFSKN